MSQEKNKKITLNIGGMSCINCSLTIEKALSKLNGVIHATVNFAAEKAIIEYSPDLVDQKTIENIITEAGYRVIHEKIMLQVGGMSCVNCAQSIEKALNSKEGVYNATVNFATEKVSVEYNPEQISLAGISKTIQDVGYQVIEPEKALQDTEDKERQRNIRRLKILLATSVALTIPTILFTWFPVLPKEQNNILLFIIATPVQFIVGWTFYVGAYKGLRNKTTNMDTLIAMGTSTAWLYSTAVTFAPSVFPGAGVSSIQPQ